MDGIIVYVVGWSVYFSFRWSLILSSLMVGRKPEAGPSPEIAFNWVCFSVAELVLSTTLKCTNTTNSRYSKSRSACGRLIGSPVKRVTHEQQSAPSVAPLSSNGPCKVVIYIQRWILRANAQDLCTQLWGGLLQKWDTFCLRHLSDTLIKFKLQSINLQPETIMDKNSVFYRKRNAALFSNNVLHSSKQIVTSCRKPTHNWNSINKTNFGMSVLTLFYLAANCNLIRAHTEGSKYHHVL